MLTVGSAQALGYVAALATLVAPAGLGVRDAVFAWAVKGAVPGSSFAVGSLIAIAVRGVLTVVEVIYVAARHGAGPAPGLEHPHRCPPRLARGGSGRRGGQRLRGRARPATALSPA